jgi:hypothetical protein
MMRPRAVGLILTAAGFALFVWMIRKAGPANLWSGLVSVGWGFAVILALSLARFALRSAAWIALLHHPASLGAALSATLVGDALGNATPLGLAASEPAKAAVLGRRVPVSDAFAALAAENFFYSVSVAVYIIAGALVLLTGFSVPEALRWSGLVSLAAMTGVLVAAGWIAWQQPSATSGLLARLPVSRATRVLERLHRLEQRMYEAGRRDPSRLARMALAEIGFHVSSFLESWLTLWLLTGVSAPLAAFVFDSVNRVINVIFKNIPFRTGVDEYSAAVVASAIGIAPSTGLVMALVRKVRVVVWAGVGFAIWMQRRPGSEAWGAGGGPDRQAPGSTT